MALGRTAARDLTRAPPALPAAESFRTPSQSQSQRLSRVHPGGEQRQDIGVGTVVLFPFSAPHFHRPSPPPPDLFCRCELSPRLREACAALQRQLSQPRGVARDNVSALEDSPFQMKTLSPPRTSPDVFREAPVV